MRIRKVASKASIRPVTVTGLVMVVPAAGESTFTVSGVPGFGLVAHALAAAVEVVPAGEAVAVTVSAAGVVVRAAGLAEVVARVALALGEGLVVSSLLEQAATRAMAKQGIAISESIFIAPLTTPQSPSLLRPADPALSVDPDALTVRGHRDVTVLVRPEDRSIP